MISLLHLNDNSLLILSNRFPRWLSSRESACSARGAGDPGSITGAVRSPGGGHGNPLQYSCLENPMDRGAGWATVHGVARGWTRLSTHTHVHKSTRSYEVGWGKGPVWAGSLQGLSFFLLAPKEGGHQGFLRDFPVGG